MIRSSACEMFRNFNRFHQNTIKGVRSFKNFGHGREKHNVVTGIWHTALTAMFLIGIVDWSRIIGVITGTKGWKVRPEEEEREEYHLEQDSDVANIRVR